MGGADPFLKHARDFWDQWRLLKYEQLLREDIATVTHISDLGKIELLAELLRQQAGQVATFATLAKKVGVAATTVQSWVQTLQECYYCFLIRPWSHNVIRSLLKEPKVYLMDWSDITDPGAKTENFVASHLLKAVQFWTDTGQGKCELYFVRDKEKREVDFLVVKNKEPWFLVEVKKSGNQSISEHLYYFHKMLKTQHAFQVDLDLEYQHVDCFTYLEPVIVPAATFLSQLC